MWVCAYSCVTLDSSGNVHLATFKKKNFKKKKDTILSTIYHFSVTLKGFYTITREFNSHTLK